MTTDAQLLDRYLDQGSEPAFAELVRRHLDLVYAAALRQLRGDEALAKDVAQSVFVDLARKASSLRGRNSLAGWLYTSARFAAISALRSEERRRMREEEAARMQENSSAGAGEPGWNQINGVIDEAMHELEDPDREAIVLRFFEGLDLRTVGAAFGISDDAARKRVDRALEKLRDELGRRGIRSTGAALTAALGCAAISATPKDLSAVITHSVCGTGFVPDTTPTLLAMTKTKIAIAAGLALAGLGIAAAVHLSATQNRKTASENVQRPPKPKPGGDMANTATPPVSAAKVAMLDQKQVFDSSPKTREFDKQIRTLGLSMEQENQRLVKDDSVAPEEKDRRIRQFRFKAGQELEEKKQRMRAEIMSDISTATAEVARKRGFRFVLDKEALDKGVTKVLFTSDASEDASPQTNEWLNAESLNLTDLTQDVLKRLPRDHPE